jgi:hypothetical protein
MSLAAMTVRLEPSAFVPLALGFFGLGVGYLIYGPQELVGYPPRDRKVDVTTGIWGIWVPGFLQFVSGLLLFVGLSWFGSFDEKPLYMAAVAFTAYGVHWWAIGMGRVFSSDPRPNALMSVPFLVLSVLGAVVFFGAHDDPVGGLCSRPAFRRTRLAGSPRSAMTRSPSPRARGRSARRSPPDSTPPPERSSPRGTRGARPGRGSGERHASCAGGRRAASAGQLPLPLS